jgi:bacteriocin-like protein
MAKTKINNLNHKNQMVELDEKQLSNIVGGGATSWHVYHGGNGRVIKREWEDDGKDIVVHHRP